VTTSRSLARALALGAAILSAGGTAFAQATEKPVDPTTEATELVNALLGALMGGEEMGGRRLQEEVARVGGIPFRWDVPIAYMTHDELARYLAELLDDQYPPATAESDERLLVALDLLEPGTDLRALRARLLEENIAGFYDERPDRRRLYAVSEDRTLTPMNQIVLAHELRHALQDQYGNLHSTLPDDVGDFDDRRIAFLSLLEGDATLVMEKFLQSRLGLSGLGLDGALGDRGGASTLDGGLGVPGLLDIPGAPPVLRDLLILPYLVGRDLARSIVTSGGSEAMIEAWERPPDSTEQVLHPAKYLAREAPRPVVPRPDPSVGRLVGQGVLGELLLRTLLDQEGDGPPTAGWGGDAWRLWDTGGPTVLVWTSVWDTGEDAAEFDAALRGRFARRLATLASREEWSVYQRSDGWLFAVRRQGDEVDLRSSDTEEGLADVLR